MGSTGHMIGCDSNWQGNTKKYLDKQLNGINMAMKWEVLASETRGGVYYAAVKRTMLGSGNFEVFAMVQPYSFYGKGWARELVVKDQDEFAGPYDCDASARILDLLTETDSEYANEWREKCRANLAAKAAKPTVEVGDVLVFSQPFTFGNYGTASKFRVREWGRRKRFDALDGGYTFSCRLTRWALSTEYIVEKG